MSPHMRRRLVFLAVSLLILVQPSWGAGHRRALLVGLGPYARHIPAWKSLHGAQDCLKFADVLKLYWGFHDDEIHILPDEEAKCQAIKDEFEKWLVKGAQPGDTLIFFYSGHGTLVPAPDLPATGVRSAIVPIDARLDADKNIVEESVLTGKFFRDWQIELKSKGFTNLTMFFDSCHSAAITKGLAVSKYVPNPIAEKAISDKGGSEFGLGTEINLSDFVTFFAAKTMNSAFECSEGGNLTVSLCEAVSTYFLLQKSQGVSHDMTYGDLRDLTLAKMASKEQPVPQDPGMNGNPDRVVFGGPAAQSDRFFLVHVPRTGPIKSKKIQVMAGSLYGIQRGFEMAIFPVGSSSVAGSKPLGHGRVVSVDVRTCDVQLEDGFAGDVTELDGAKALLSDFTPGATIAVDTSSLAADPKYKPILDKIKSWAFVSQPKKGESSLFLLAPDAKPPLIGVPTRSDWSLVDGGGRLRMSVSADTVESQLVDQLHLKLRNLARNAALLALSSAEPRYKVEMEVVPLMVDAQDAIIKVGPGAATSVQVFGDDTKDSDRFAVRVRATLANGAAAPSKSVFLNLLNVQQDLTLTRPWPVADFVAQDSVRLPCDGRWLYLGNSADGGDILATEQQLDKITKFYEVPERTGFGRDELLLLATEDFLNYVPDPTMSLGVKSVSRSRLSDILMSFDKTEAVPSLASRSTTSEGFCVARATVFARPGKERPRKPD